MSEFRVAKRYAQSIFDLAIERRIVDRIYSDMLVLEQTCNENRNLVILLKNPIVRYDYKLRVLTRVFGKHVDILTMNFFHLICRKNRASILPEVSNVFVMLYHDHKGIVKAGVTTAVKISASIRKEFEEIVTKITGKKVAMETSVDESLIGGYILKVGDMQIDDSVKSKLNNLRRELKSRP